MATKKKREVLVDPALIEAVLESAIVNPVVLTPSAPLADILRTESRDTHAHAAGTSEAWNLSVEKLRVFFTGLFVGSFSRGTGRGVVAQVLDSLPLNTEGRNAVTQYICDHPIIRIAVDAIEHNSFGVAGWVTTVNRLYSRGTKKALPEGITTEVLDVYSKVVDAQSFSLLIYRELLDPLTQIISAQLLSAPGGPTAAIFTALADFRGKMAPPEGIYPLVSLTRSAAVATTFLACIEGNLEQEDEDLLTVTFAKVTPAMVATILFKKVVDKTKPKRKFG